MKSIYFSLALLISSSTVASAAMGLIGGDTSNGIANAAGTAAIGTGSLRIGTFLGSYVPSASDTQAVIQANFVEIFGFSGSIEAVGDAGFYTLSTTYDETGTFGGLPYDGSLTNTNVAGDIAGSKVYLWVYNSNDALLATEQLIFSSDALWGDSDNLDLLNNIVPTNFAWDSAAAGLTAHIGSIASVDSPVYPGVGITAHQTALVAAIPEPSRAMLAGLGLGVAFLRRRRRA